MRRRGRSAGIVANGEVVAFRLAPVRPSPKRRGRLPATVGGLPSWRGAREPLRAFARLAWTTVSVLKQASQPTRCLTFALWRGVLPPPLRSPRKTSAPAAFTVGKFRPPPSAWPNLPGSQTPDGSPADHRSPPVEAVSSRVSLRQDRRAAGSALPPLRRRSPRPPGRASARPSSRGRAPFPARQGSVGRSGLTRLGPVLGGKAFEDRWRRVAPPPFEPPASRASATGINGKPSVAGYRNLPRGIALGAKRHVGLGSMLGLWITSLRVRCSDRECEAGDNDGVYICLRIHDDTRDEGVAKERGRVG